MNESLEFQPFVQHGNKVMRKDLDTAQPDLYFCACLSGEEAAKVVKRLNGYLTVIEALTNTFINYDQAR